MGNKSKRGGGNNGGFQPKNRIKSVFADQKTPLALPQAPEHYPNWIKSVYKDLQVAVNSARRDPSLDINDVMILLQMTNLICEYLFHSATHFAEISNSDVDKMQNVNVIKGLVEQFKKQKDELVAAKKADGPVEAGAAAPEATEGAQSQETKE